MTQNKKQSNSLALVVQTKPKQPKQPKKKKTSKPKSGGGGNALSGLIRQVCSVTDPFCPHAIGAKWPDGNAVRSMPVAIRGFVTVSTNAGGHAAVIFNPAWPYGYSVATTATAGACDFPAFTAYTGTSDYTNIGSRLVVGGIRIMNIGAPLNASGVLTVASMAGTDSQSFQNVDFSNTLFNEYYTRPFASIINTEAVAVFKPGSMQSRMFHQNNVAAVATQDSEDWSALAVHITGAPISQAVLRVEYVLMYELQFHPNSVFNRLATPPRAANPVVTQASSGVQAHLQNVASQTAQQLGKTVIDHAGKFIVRQIGGAIGSALRIPGGRAAGLMLADAAMDVD